MNAIAKLIATVFYIGYAPFAPGTFGTLAAVIFVYLLRPDAAALMILLVVGFCVGILCSNKAEKDFGVKDSGKIVIDEFIGYLTSVVFLPLTTVYIIAAFFLFRFFDILKPPPIRQCERLLSGGLGVMADDLLAGIFTNIVLQVWGLI